MYISNNKRKYIKRYAQSKSAETLSLETGLPVSVVNEVIAELGFAKHGTPVQGNILPSEIISSVSSVTSIYFYILVFAVVVAPLFFISGLYDMYSLAKFSFLTVLAPVCVAAFLIDAYRKNAVSFIPCFKYPLLPLVGFILLGALSMFWSINKYDNFSHIQLWLIAVIFFYFSLNSYSSITQLKVLSLGITVSASIISILGIFQFFGINPGFLFQAAVPGTTFGNKNFATPFVVASYPFCLYSAYCYRDKILGAVLSFCFFVMAYFIIITRTRSAWVSMAVSLVIGLFLLSVYAKRNNTGGFFKPVLLKWKKFVLPGLAFASIFLVVSILPSTKPENVTLDIRDELKSMADTGKGSAHWRLTAWANTLLMIKAKPILGYGWGNWEFSYPLFARQAMVDKDFSEKTQAKNAHNDYLQTFAELGILGILFFLWFFYNVISISLKGFFRGGGSESCFLGLACFVSVLSLMGDACFNFPFQESVPVFFLAVVFSMASYVYFKDSHKGSAVFEVSKYQIIYLLLTGVSFALVALAVNWAFKLCKADYYFLEGKRLSANNQYEESLIPLKNSISLNPYNYRTYSLLGRSMNELRMYYDAVDINKKALALHPNYINCMNNLGNALRGIHHPDDAIEVYKKAIELYPNFAEAYNNMGIGYKEKSDFDNAKKCYLKSIELDPKYEKAYNNLGNIYLAENNLDKAMEYYAKTISVNPKLPDVYNNLGLALSKKGEYGKAIENFDKCIELTSRLPDPYHNKGAALRGLGKTNEAIEQFNRALMINQRYLPAYNSLAETYIAQNKPDLAVGQYEKMLDIDPNLKSVYQVLAETYMRLYEKDKSAGIIDKAVAVLERGAGLFPDSSALTTVLGKIYLESGQRDKALEVFKKCAEVEPDKPETYYNLGIVYHQNNDLNNALSNYKIALEKNPDFIFLKFEIGKIYEQQNNKEEAVKYFTGFIQQWKGDRQYITLAHEKINKLSGNTNK